MDIHLVRVPQDVDAVTSEMRRTSRIFSVHVDSYAMVIKDWEMGHSSGAMGNH